MSEPSKLFSVISAFSGYSLVVCGALSLLLSSFLFAPSGIFVGLAILAHGLWEIACRKGVVVKGRKWSLSWMIRNQLLLAVSITMYAAWQMRAFDDDAAARLLAREELQSLLQLYPAEVRYRIVELAPMLGDLFYSIIMASVWVACICAALFYKLQGPSWIQEA